MLNSIVLQGRICTDLELKSTSSGIAVLSFRIAVDRDYGTNGDKQTDFINIVAWRNTAEFISRYFSKGRMIILQGALNSRKYDKNGEQRVMWEVVADRAWFGDSKTESKQDNQEPEQPPEQPAQYSTDNSEFTPLSEDDLPF